MYAVTWPEELRKLCIKFNFFNAGSNFQYVKLFNANSLPGWNIRDLADMIWICTQGWTYHEIAQVLEDAHDYYMEVMNNENV